MPTLSGDKSLRSRLNGLTAGYSFGGVIPTAPLRYVGTVTYAMTEINSQGEKIMLVEELMSTIERLGNHELVAQTRFALEADGITVDGPYCQAAFVGVAYTMELAERAHESGALSIGEMVATQQVCSLSMQIWATLHYQVTTGNLE